MHWLGRGHWRSQLEYVHGHVRRGWTNSTTSDIRIFFDVCLMSKHQTNINKHQTNIKQTSNCQINIKRASNKHQAGIKRTSNEYRTKRGEDVNQKPVPKPRKSLTSNAHCQDASTIKTLSPEKQKRGQHTMKLTFNNVSPCRLSARL